MHPKCVTFSCLCLSVAHTLVVKVKYNFPGSGKEYGLSDESFGEGGQLHGAGKDHRGVKVLAHVPICTKIFPEPLPRWWISLRRPLKTWMYTQVWWKGPWQEPQLPVLLPARWILSQTKSSILKSLSSRWTIWSSRLQRRMVLRWLDNLPQLEFLPLLLERLQLRRWLKLILREINSNHFQVQDDPLSRRLAALREWVDVVSSSWFLQFYIFDDTESSHTRVFVCAWSCEKWYLYIIYTPGDLIILIHSYWS